MFDIANVRYIRRLYGATVRDGTEQDVRYSRMFDISRVRYSES